MRPLPVLLLVIIALGIFYIAWPSGDVEPQAPPVLAPTHLPAAAPETEADMQQPDASSPLESVPATADRRDVDTSHATLANSIRGTVMASGKPVRGATVTLTRYGPENMLFGAPDANQRAQDLSLETGPDGIFLFRNVESYVQYSVIAKHPTLGREEEGNIQVAEGESKEGLVITLGDGVRLHGNVTDTTGNPIPGARLSLGLTALGAASDEDNPNTLTTTSGADGSYEYLSVAPGNYSMTVASEGFGRLTILQVNITGQASVERDVVLGLAYMIGGTVTAADGAAVIGARVQAFSTSNRKESSRSEVFTNDTGEFLFDDVISGIYTLMVSAEGFQPDRQLRVETGQMALQVTLTALPVVRGRVVDPLGQPVANFTVLLRTPIQGTETTMAMPESAKKFKGAVNGEFVLSVPRPTRYMIEAQCPGYAPSFSELFETSPGQELAGVVVQLTAGGILRGRVVNAQGEGVGGARVKTHDSTYSDDPFWRSLPAFPSQATQMEVRTSASGDFEIKGLAAATYQVDIRHAQYAQVVKTGIVVSDGDLMELPEVLLSQGASISGTVYGPSGKGMPGALVQLQLDGGPDEFAVNQTARTDSGGRYSFQHIPAGAYFIHAQRRSNDNPFQGSLDLKKTKTRISVSEGDSYTQTFNISN